MKTNHGTDEKTLELMHKATGLIEDMNADVTRLKGDVRSLKMAHGALGGIRDSETSLQLRSDVARLPRGQAMKALFELKHGEAASEALEGFGRFLKACWHKSRGNHEEAARYASEELKMTSDWTVRGKAYNTVTGATAGTMVPDVWVPELDRLKQVYGRLVAMCRTIEVPPGVEANVSGMSAATMTWRPTQNTSITESEPEAVNLKLRPVLLGGICTVSNELLELESLNFGAVIGEEFIRAGVQAEEEALLQGDDGGVHPHDGILLLSGTSDQGNIATMTRENLMTFLSAAQLDHPGIVAVYEVGEWEGRLLREQLRPDAGRRLPGPVPGDRHAGVPDHGHQVRDPVRPVDGVGCPGAGLSDRLQPLPAVRRERHGRAGDDVHGLRLPAARPPALRDGGSLGRCRRGHYLRPRRRDVGAVSSGTAPTWPGSTSGELASGRPWASARGLSASSATASAQGRPSRTISPPPCP